MAKYDPLRQHLENEPPDRPVRLSFRDIEGMVGLLPSGAAQEEWWISTSGSRVQARAWTGAGRVVEKVVPGKYVVFGPQASNGAPAPTHQPDELPLVTTSTYESPGRPGAASLLTELVSPPPRRPSADPLLDGLAMLEDLLGKAGFTSVAEAVAANTLFLHPDTVRQTGGQAVFRSVRDVTRRGRFGFLPDGREVLYDDNRSPAWTFMWAAGHTERRDIQFTQVWAGSKDPDVYTALWNICVTPAFLATTIEGCHHDAIMETLRFRSFDLYGRLPAGVPKPEKPEGYGALRWLPHLPAAADLQAVLRGRMAQNPHDRITQSARRLGWVFSGWEPDKTV